MTLLKYNAAGEMLQDEARFAPGGVVCSAYLSAATGSASGVRKVPYNATRFDPFAFFDLINSRFQPKIPGYYRLSFVVDVGAAGGYAFTQWWRNGSFYAYGSYFSSVGTETMLPDSIVVYLNGSTDYIEVYAGTSSAAPIYGNTRLDAELVAASVGVAPEPWHVIGAAGEPAFTNGWTHFDQPNGRVARFMKDPHGFVHLDGVIKSGTTGTAAFTLPVGYRPSQTEDWLMNSSPAGGTVDVNPSGAVLITNGSSYIYLTGATYRAEQ